MTLQDLGYREWAASLKDGPVDEARLARIVAVDRDRYGIAGPVGVLSAELTGRLLYCADTLEDLPCVGDWVLVDYLDHGEHAIIHEVLPRRTLLRRRAAGDRAVHQPIAANIDVAYIVQSCVVDYSLNRLDRYIVMAADGGITSRLLLAKCDLVSETERDRLVEQVRRDHRIEVTAISSTTGAGYDRLTPSLLKGMTYCLLGSSGVGKSTIVNRLLGSQRLAVSPVREKSGRGRHTTTRRQLILLPSGALLIDTPGMRELGMMGVGTGLEEGYQDIAALARECRYADCTHAVEKGCAVLAAVDAGRLSRERHQSYLKLRRESEHYAMTDQEKKQKDKAFGKMVKGYERLNRNRSRPDSP